MAWLSVAVFVALGLRMAHVDGLSVFLACAVGLLGLVKLIGEATESIANRIGPMLGGLLNASFGNVTELFIAIMALRGAHHELVRASISGSIICNLLLVLGLSMVVGGARREKQTFGCRSAHTGLLLLALCLIGLVTPTIVHLGPGADPTLTAAAAETMTRNVSLGVAIVLLVMYALSLLFSLKTHRFVLRPDSSQEAAAEDHGWSNRTAGVVLLVVTVMVGFVSDWFMDALEYMLKVQHLPLSELFVGVVIVAIVGNAAEAAVSLSMAARDNMDLAFEICMSAALQVALVTAPVLVIASWFMGNPMTLVFNTFEIAAIWAAVIVANLALADGESNWFEGAMFLGVYAIFVLVFWFHP
jgi:Ca2+:H+ antiporter